MSDEREVYRPIYGVFTPIKKAVRKPPTWVVEGLLPPGLVLLVGPPKDAYKSTLSVALAAIVAGYKQTVLPAQWRVVMGGPVMMFSYEDDAGEIKFMAEEGMGIELPDDDGILIADDPSDWRLDDDDALERMFSWLDERKPRLVVCDPLVNFHSVEEKDAGKMIQLLSPLRRWAKENDATFLLVHHPRKLDDERAYRASDIRGSGALFGACDALLMLTPTKNRLQVEIAATFKKHPGWVKTVDIAAWERRGERGHLALKDLDKIILKTIMNGSSTIEEISTDINVAKRVVAERIEFLREQGLVAKKGRKIVHTREAA